MYEFRYQGLTALFEAVVKGFVTDLSYSYLTFGTEGKKLL